MKKNLFYKVGAIALASMCTLGITGCGDNKKNVASNDDNSLEVYLWNAGYGYEWLEVLLQDFGQQAWVKEKYPNYQYFTVINDQNTYGQDRMAAGSSNTIDLFMTGDMDAYFGSGDLVDLKEVVFEKEVPGENVLYKDKMLPAIYSSLGYTPYGEDKTYYETTPWTMGVGGIVYNKTLFEELGLTVPRTTDELFEMMDTVKSWNGTKAAYPYTYSYIASQITYADYMFPVFWAQYEGLDNYTNFQNAIDEEGVHNSINILYQKGRLEAWKVWENLLTEANGYYDRSSPNRDFISGQSYLLLRRGLFMTSGDWFSNEMKDLAEGYKAEGYNDVVSMMKTPIVSAIKDKLTTIKTDELLRQVIDEIDSGATSSAISGVSQADFDRVREARGVMMTNNSSSHTVIPSNASAKELAIDFLRYMATDKANELYATYTSGGKLPFQYDFRTQAADKYNELNKTQSSTLFLQAEVGQMLLRPHMSIMDTKATDFAKYGGFSIYAGSTTSDWFNGFVYGGATSQDLWQAPIDYYTADNNAKWTRCLQNAGML